MFAAIAPRYDLLNRILSLGIDQYWRRQAVAALLEGLPAGPIVDVATGTGDIALEILRQSGNTRHVVGIDVTVDMLQRAQIKCQRKQAAQYIDLLAAPCEALPLKEQSMAGASIAFGIRNVDERQRSLKELGRVLQPGGRLIILEFSLPQKGVFAACYRVYFHKVLPRIAGLLAMRSAYHYLPDSVQEFPSPAAFAQELAEQGFDNISHSPLTGGIATIYTAHKPH